MKKRLSLLMVLMMVLSLVPMSAFATAGTVPGGVISVDDQYEQTKNVTVKLTQAAGTQLTSGAQAKLTLNKGEFNADGIVSVSGTVNVKPAVGANQPATVTGDLVKLGNFDETAYLTLHSNVEGMLLEDLDIYVSFVIAFDNESVGDVTLSVDEVNDSEITVAKPIVVGVVTESVDGDMKVTVKDSEKKIGMEKGTLSTFTVSDIDENNDSSTSPATVVDTMVFELPDFMTWTTDTKITVGSSVVTVTAGMIDGEKLTISGLTLADTKKDIMVEPDLTVKSKDAKMGDVVVDITAKQGTKELETIDAVIGQVVNYDVTMTAVENGKKEIPSLYGGEKALVKVTISGVKGSFTADREIDFTVDGADVTTKSFQLKSGVTAQPAISTDEATDGMFDDGEFSLRVKNLTGVDEVEFVMEIQTDVNKDGAVSLTAESRDFDDLEVEIAKVTPAYTVSVEKVTEIKKGESLATANIVIKEAKAGMFETDQFLVLSLNDNYSGGLTFGSDYKIELTNDLDVDDDLVNDGGTNRGEKNTLALEITDASRKEAGTITISNVLVNVSGSEVDGIKDLETFLVDATSLVNAITASTGEEEDADYSVDYVNVVKEYGVTATTTVFVIGSKSYTVNGEMMTANEAPFIAGKGYTMLPVRALAESLGLKADWNSNTKTATFSNDSKVASVTMGASTMYVNGTPIPLNAKAEIKNGSTFIELRSLASAFGVELQWDAATKTVTIIG